ncbi:MAG TPA: hypothetical protein VIK89_09485 [Cytophagaceae bacterium]
MADTIFAGQADSTFVIQIILSFFVGGGLITLLSMISERVSERISGIVMMFPSVIIIGFFFLGLTSSADQVAEVIPATLIPLGLVIFSSAIYIYSAIFYSGFIKSRYLQIALTFLTGSLVWLLLAAPFAIWKFSNLPVGVVGYFLFIALTHFLMNRVKFTEKLSRPKYTKIQILARAAFTGTMIAAVVFLGRVLDPFWGGIFTMFPSVSYASLVIFNIYYPPQRLFYFFKKAPLGSISLLIYSLCVILLFPKLGVVWGTLACCGISMSYSFLLIGYKLRFSGNSQ